MRSTEANWPMAHVSVFSSGLGSGETGKTEDTNYEINLFFVFFYKFALWSGRKSKVYTFTTWRLLCELDAKSSKNPHPQRGRLGCWVGHQAPGHWCPGSLLSSLWSSHTPDSESSVPAGPGTSAPSGLGQVNLTETQRDRAEWSVSLCQRPSTDAIRFALAEVKLSN